MQIIFTFIEGLPEDAKILVIGFVLRTFTQIVKRTFLKGWLAAADLRPAKVAKLATVAIFAALAAAIQSEVMSHGWEWAVGTWLAYTAYGVLVHEGWQKIVVEWFGHGIAKRLLL